MTNYETTADVEARLRRPIKTYRVSWTETSQYALMPRGEILVRAQDEEQALCYVVNKRITTAKLAIEEFHG